MSIIFFGISNESHIGRHINKWISIAGTPDIFSERDDHVIKYQPKLLEKYEVISIDEALKRYPDADVWITYNKASKALKAAKFLAIKLSPEKIHFLQADLEYRKGCSYLGHFISYGEKTFSLCTVSGRKANIKTEGSFHKRMEQWQDYTTKLIDDIRNERPNKCQNCHMLKYGFWDNTVKLTTLTLSSNRKGDACNFRCIYCFANKTLKRVKDEVDGPTTYEILQQLYEMSELDTDEFTIRFSNGEFCVNKYCDEMLDILLKTKWKIELVSNSSVYRESLATLMENGRIVKLITSLDAGTRETFQKIKRNDRFDKVVENLKRYPTSKTKLLLKYIFLEGVNDNEIDIDGFYEIVKEVSATVMFSSDLHYPYTEKMKELVLRIIKKAKADGIKVTNGNYLHPLDVKFVKENYESI